MSKRKPSTPAKKAGPGRGRKEGQTSPRIADAARKVGKLGGRPRDKLPAEVLARLGTPATGATAHDLRVWNARVLAEVQLLTLQGKIGHELAQTIRANATALDKSLPTDRDPGPDDGEEDEDDPEGPELETDDGAGEGLRVG